ncbi:uncharacterized protein LOC130234882 [Danio aesculapii]|uniref:uncharacterized protein LOC130234882 n=1 Tax=Danio aesculapii TaxID=1142201 RepID=UPI0024BF8520|nr:uncharacterized protein LOC130234882 [Danio aesculapii]
MAEGKSRNKFDATKLTLKLQAFQNNNGVFDKPGREKFFRGRENVQDMNSDSEEDILVDDWLTSKQDFLDTSDEELNDDLLRSDDENETMRSDYESSSKPKHEAIELPYVVCETSHRAEDQARCPKEEHTEVDHGEVLDIEINAPSGDEFQEAGDCGVHQQASVKVDVKDDVKLVSRLHEESKKMINRMLFKVQYQARKRYMKLPVLAYDALIREVKEKFGISPDHTIYLADETGTEVDEDVFADIMEQKPDTLWTIVDSMATEDSTAPPTSQFSSEMKTVSPTDSCVSVLSTKRPRTDDQFTEAKELVKDVLGKKSAGEKIFQEYRATGKITDSTRRILVNAVVGDMIEKHGNIPPKEIRIKYAVGIVTLFPSLKDPYSKRGYEHFYDPEGNSGYIAWRLKTVQAQQSTLALQQFLIPSALNINTPLMTLRLRISISPPGKKPSGVSSFPFQWLCLSSEWVSLLSPPVIISYPPAGDSLTQKSPASGPAAVLSRRSQDSICLINSTVLQSWTLIRFSLDLLPWAPFSLEEMRVTPGGPVQLCRSPVICQSLGLPTAGTALSRNIHQLRPAAGLTLPLDSLR